MSETPGEKAAGWTRRRRQHFAYLDAHFPHDPKWLIAVETFAALRRRMA
jgi:hypothetical protein